MSSDPPKPSRFLTIPEVAVEPATSDSQISALVKRGDLVALKVGGRGQWRIERSQVEVFIGRAYEETERELRENGRIDVEPEVDTSALPATVCAVIDDGL